MAEFSWNSFPEISKRIGPGYAIAYKHIVFSIQAVHMAITQVETLKGMSCKKTSKNSNINWEFI